MEFASGNGNEERVSTPILMTDEGDVQKPSKFWVYEQIIRIPYYGIYEMSTDRLEVYHLRDLSDKKLFLGIPAGILAAVRKNSWVDNLTMSGALIGVSLPVYWLGLMLIYLFAVYIKWLPPNGRISVDLGFGFKPITGVYALDALLRLN